MNWFQANVSAADFQGARFAFVESKDTGPFPEQALAELIVGTTTRGQIPGVLGEPLAQLLDGSLMIYGLARHEGGTLHRQRSHADEYTNVDLVLIFDARDRLERSVLVSGDRADFLVDGKTTKREVVLRLGAPSRQFEGERVLTYRLTQGLMPTREIRNWEEARYSLVLVFDAANVLQRHRVVEVK